MYVIDKNGGVAWFEQWMPLGKNVTSIGYISKSNLTKIAHQRGWTVQETNAAWEAGLHSKALATTLAWPIQPVSNGKK